MGLAALLVVICASLVSQGQPPPPPGVKPAPEAPIRQLIVSLSPKSVWRKMLEQGARGDGIRRPWMDEMRKQGINLAVVTFEFDWLHGGYGLKNLHNWRLVSMKYFTGYGSLSTLASDPVSDLGRLSAARASGLQSTLEAVALARAKRGIWVEDPGHQHPPRQTGTGYRWVILAENEWLPVQMFPWFAAYGEGTTPLMHAAILGDVERIKNFLAQGADVNAVSSDGSTALVYAAEGESPDAVQTLLAAGADPDKATNDGSTALMTAAAADALRSVGLLLEAGANPDARDAHGNSALSIAAQRDHAEVVRLLRQAGARE